MTNVPDSRPPIDRTEDALEPSDAEVDLALPIARVQEAAVAGAVVVLKTRVPGQTHWIVVGAAPSSGGAASGLLTTEARKRLWGGRLPPGLARERGREDALVGARILALTSFGVLLDQGGIVRALRPRGDRVVVADPPDTSAGGEKARAADEAFAIECLRDTDRAGLEARGEALAVAISAVAIGARRGEIARAVDKGIARVERRIEAIARDLSNIDEAGRIAGQASWLVAEAKRAPRGAKELVVTDWTTGEPVPLTIALDPSKSATEQIEAMFKRAKRLRLGARIAEERHAQAVAQRDRLREVRRALEGAAELPAVEELAREAKRVAPRDVTLAAASEAKSEKRAADGAKPRTPFRTFLARSGRRILVGKGAADNDALTLKVARPHDLWLHAKDRTGAHVVVPLDKGRTCPGDDLVDAAHLAAHFSDARGEAVVDVQYASRRHLRKPKGSAAGFVIVDREKVLVLRVDAEATRALLEREEL